MWTSEKTFGDPAPDWSLGS